MTKGSERQYVLKILEDLDNKKVFMNQLVDDYFFVYDFDKQQRSFITRVVYGTIENQNYLDFCINLVSKIKVNKMKPTIRLILRMSAYQLVFMDKVPAHAAINEAVKLTQKRKFVNLKNFVNGVLRNIERQKNDFDQAVMALPKNQYLSVKYSINEALVNYLLKEYTVDALEIFLKNSQRDKPTCVRTNTLVTTTLQLKQKLGEACQIEEGHLLEDSFYLSGYDRLTMLEPFQKGEFQVQDESSTLVGLIANPNKETKVLDVCAAPGGKTTHMAILMENQGELVSCDLTEAKTQKIKDNCERLALSNVSVKMMDATRCQPEYRNAFDIVVADVPCSGLGILRSKPDIKHNMTVEKIDALIEIQKSILQNVKEYVKVGGELIYSTCTINSNENGHQINEFLRNNTNFICVDLALEKHLNPTIKGYIHQNYLQLITDPNLTDGFFIAKLKRIKE